MKLAFYPFAAHQEGGPTSSNQNRARTRSREYFWALELEKAPEALFR